jgi:hypothetical protein
MAVRRPISRIGIPLSAIIGVGVLLALLEAPANKFLFDAALQSSGFVSYSVSVGLTAFLLLLAHFAGRSVRQVWMDYRHKVVWSNVLIFLATICIATTIIGILTVARAAFGAEVSSIDALVNGIQTNVTSRGPFGALLAALGDMSALVLATINLGGFFVALFIAFFTHDSDRDYDQAQSALDRAEKRLRTIHAVYLKQRARIVKGVAPDLIGFAANYNDANRRVIELKTRLGMPLEDDDRLVLTDLDQMSEDADRADEPVPLPTPPDAPRPPGGNPHGTQRLEPTIASVVGLRRQTGTEPS